jgi:hypothetical protein
LYPGITGKQLQVWFVNADEEHKNRPSAWAALSNRLTGRHGVFQVDRTDAMRAWYSTLVIDDGTRERVIAFIKLDTEMDSPEADWRHRAKLDFLFDVRDATRGRANEIVFVLFHDRSEITRRHTDTCRLIGEQAADRLKRYFVIDTGLDDAKLPAAIDAAWTSALREVMTGERFTTPGEIELRRRLRPGV